jgi:hypothetical protein
MTTREIVAIFLFYMGFQTLSGSILYGHVASGGSDVFVIASFALGVALIVAGIVALRWEKGADGLAAISIPPN